MMGGEQQSKQVGELNQEQVMQILDYLPNTLKCYAAHVHFSIASFSVLSRVYYESDAWVGKIIHEVGPYRLWYVLASND